MSLDHLFGDKPGALLIDLSQIALATVSVSFDPGTTFNTSMIRHLVLSTLKHNALKFKSEGFTHVVIAVDNTMHGYWRRQYKDYYKRNRAIKREADKDKFDWDGYYTALKEVIGELKEHMPYVVIDVVSAEADDCIAVLTKYLVSKGFKVRIVSSDGDFTQLHTYEDVDQYSPIQKKFVKPKTGSPEEDCMVKILKGDKKDCVASTRVRGDYYLTYDPETERTPQTSEVFIKSFVGKSDDEIYQIFLEDALKKANHKKQGVDNCRSLLSLYGMPQKAIESFGEQTDLMAERIAKLQHRRFTENRILIDFNYIREDIQQSILDAYESYVPAPRGKIYSYFVKSGLSKLIPDINSF